MNGVIYCRVSSKEQIEGTSLETQELACREYARSKNIKILKVFIEQGESAKFADRAQLLELIDFCRKNKHKLQYLLVWKVDRFARNVTDHFNIKATLMKYGVHIESVTEPIDSNPNGKLMETILAGFAEFDNDIRSLRCIEGMRRKLQDGLFPWKPPLGYKSTTLNGEKKTEPDIPDQPLFALLQRAWREFATGAYTKAEIRRLMDGWGITTNKGKPMSPQSVDKLFQNKYYVGTLVDPWSGEELQGKHAPMVTREDFARVQRVIASRNRSIPHQKERPEFPLRGFSRCQHCSHYLTGGFTRGRSRRYAYYLCQRKQCDNRGKSVPVATIHQEFGGFLDEITPKRELLEKLGELIIKTADERRSFLKAKKARIKTELSQLDRETQELIGMRTRELITDKEFLNQKATLWNRQMTLESTPLDDPLDPVRLRKELSEITQPLLELRSTWGRLPFPFRRRFERLVLPAGFVHGRIRTADLGLLFRVSEGFSRTNTTDVDPGCIRLNRILQEMRGFWRLFRGYQEVKGPPKKAVRT